MAYPHFNIRFTGQNPMLSILNKFIGPVVWLTTSTKHEVDCTSQHWLVDVDVEALLVKKDIVALRAADKRQRELVGQYWAYSRELDLQSVELCKAPTWKKLVEAIGTKTTHSEEYHAFLNATQLANGGIKHKQRKHSRKIGNALESLARIPLAERMAKDVGVPVYDPSKYFDSTESDKYAIQLAPLPYGATVDDTGMAVEHYILWTCHDLYDPQFWQQEDIAEIRLNGIGGLIGFDTTSITKDIGGGYTGHPGAYQIEQAISKRFKPSQYRTAWYINARSKQTIPALPHVHMWVAPKRA